ncbi:MAG: S8 family serine peptidase [Micromonosporaceae bacterium]
MSKRRIGAGLFSAVVLAFMIFAPPGASAAPGGEQIRFTVVSEKGVSAASAVAAINRAGGTIVARNDDVGMFSVLATEGFAQAAIAAPELIGAAAERTIGQMPDAATVRDTVEQEGVAAAAGGNGVPVATAGADPLNSLQWNMAQVRADLAHAKQPGSPSVTVGIIDSGIDGTHPDLAPNLDLSLSRNFAPDRPDIDGPCEVPSCLDPVGQDDNGHGSHVAGIVAAAANGLGVAGVAPNVTLVEIKGGQDSGFLFLEPVVNSLTYAGDIGIDVVNMSFYIDPWLYNCQANPADSPAAQAEQRAIVEAVNRALDYAHDHGVTLVGSLGNNHEDLGHPRTDFSSPDYPRGTAYPRPIDNATCVDLPIEGPHVIGTSALGPSTAKADYSNYGTEQISVSAPGGYFRDFFGTPQFRQNANQVLSTYPKAVLQRQGRVDAAGNVTPAGVAAGTIRDCNAGVCGYYQYLQGTSMASPHTVGVAALIVSRFGQHDPAHPGVRLDPVKVESLLLRTAAEHACPVPPLFTYTNEGRPAEFNALCEGDLNFNGFYGYGIVDAYAAVTAPPAWDELP